MAVLKKCMPVLPLKWKNERDKVSKKKEELNQFLENKDLDNKGNKSKKDKEGKKKWNNKIEKIKNNKKEKNKKNKCNKKFWW